MKFRYLFIILTSQILHAEDYFFSPITNPRGVNHVCRLTSAQNMCLNQPVYNIYNEHNGDDTNVADFAGSFNKALQHDAITGILTTVGQTNYQQLLTALNNALKPTFKLFQIRAAMVSLL